MTTATATTSKHVFCLYARANGKPAGFVGQCTTRAIAESTDEFRRGGVVIKREIMPADAHARWVNAGAPFRGPFFL